MNGGSCADDADFRCGRPISAAPANAHVRQPTGPSDGPTRRDRHRQ